MVEGTNLNILDMGCCFKYEEIAGVLIKEFGYRLPTSMEAVMIDFPYEQIWTSDIIGNKYTVMDRNYGIQCIHDGNYALILVERINE